MKYFFPFILFIFFYSESSCQNKKYFHLTDTTFSIGSIMISSCSTYVNHRWQEKYEYCDSLISFLLSHPNIVVEIGQHTDSRPIPMTNDTLSQRQAQGIVAYLVSKGVPNSQLVAKGYGSRDPIISDNEISKMKRTQDKENAHSKNRRVQVTIIDIK